LDRVPLSLHPVPQEPAGPVVAQQSQGVLQTTQSQTPCSNRTSLSLLRSNARDDADTTLAGLEVKIARLEEEVRVAKKRKVEWERSEKKETLKKRYSEVAAEMARLESELRKLDASEGGEDQMKDDFEAQSIMTPHPRKA